MPHLFQISIVGQFNWDAQQQGLVLGGFSYGFCATQLLGGFLVERFGGKWVYGICAGASAALGMLSPYLAGVDISLVVALRAVQGAIQGCCLPALYSIVERWLPMQEKARLFTLIFSGKG